MLGYLCSRLHAAHPYLAAGPVGPTPVRHARCEACNTSRVPPARPIWLRAPTVAPSMYAAEISLSTFRTRPTRCQRCYDTPSGMWTRTTSRYVLLPLSLALAATVHFTPVYRMGCSLARTGWCVGRHECGCVCGCVGVRASSRVVTAVKIDAHSVMANIYFTGRNINILQFLSTRVFMTRAQHPPHTHTHSNTLTHIHAHVPTHTCTLLAIFSLGSLPSVWQLVPRA